MFQCSKFVNVRTQIIVTYKKSSEQILGAVKLRTAETMHAVVRLTSYTYLLRKLHGRMPAHNTLLNIQYNKTDIRPGAQIANVTITRFGLTAVKHGTHVIRKIPFHERVESLE